MADTCPIYSTAGVWGHGERVLAVNSSKLVYVSHFLDKASFRLQRRPITRGWRLPVGGTRSSRPGRSASVPDGCTVPPTGNCHPPPSCVRGSTPDPMHATAGCSVRVTWKRRTGASFRGVMGRDAHDRPPRAGWPCVAGPVRTWRPCGQPAGPLSREHELNSRRVMRLKNSRFVTDLAAIHS